MRHVAALLLHVVACGCLGAQPPPGSSLPERWMQANATRPPSRTAAAPSRRSVMSWAQESPQTPVARPVARSASGNASALDPHNKIKAELRVESGERFSRLVEKTRVSQTSASWLSPRPLSAAPDHARDCPELRPASANQPLGASLAGHKGRGPVPNPTGTIPANPNHTGRVFPIGFARWRRQGRPRRLSCAGPSTSCGRAGRRQRLQASGAPARPARPVRPVATRQARGP